MSDCYDFLGNKLSVGDLIIYTDSEGMPGISRFVQQFKTFIQQNKLPS